VVSHNNLIIADNGKGVKLDKILKLREDKDVAKNSIPPLP